ncbi:MAG: hypothetical protein GY853_00005, partial [PVC group bacterium]|nr:hypothetical protein [PVC group bacterium]
LVRDNAEDLLYDFGNTSGQLVNASRLLSGGNALFTAKFAEILNTRTNLFSSSFIKANIYKELTFTSTFGYERYLLDQFEYGHYEYGSAASVNGRVLREKNLKETTALINSLGYKKSINDHTFGINVISEIMDFQYDRLGAQGIGFLPDVKVLSGSTTPEDVTGYLNQERLASYLGRIGY